MTNNNNNTNKNNPKQNNKNSNSKRMVIDASQEEETRVAVLQNGKLDDFDIESLVRKQIKGNIYLAKVTRVEPSLQAAFVNYGGNRHGFLPFSEIHPDYYRIPVADRERLMAEQAELEKEAAEEAARIAAEEDEKAAKESEPTKEDKNVEEVETDETVIEAGSDADNREDDDTSASDDDDDSDISDDENNTDNDNEDNNGKGNKNNRGRGGRGKFRRGGRKKYAANKNRTDRISDDEDELSNVEPFWKRIRRAYKIQEVIKRGQIMLIQINKEERGNKGAAVTSYITLPGRYCVLMPNSPQSGGVSRKIANYKDRKRMREILKDLNVPEGMSVILRTAGTARTKIEIKRDLDYLMRLWNNIRELTLKSSAPAVVNEEGSLIKRAIRDIYHKEIDQVIVSGNKGYKSARDMMKMLMPSHVKKVVEYKDPTPLFIKEDIETQIEEMHSPNVQLKSGGYLVINPTEALISIDVNSGRSTKERNIEDTALRTNLEAAAEVARQLKLRDLGGLVVIDFIDMEKRSFNNKVEKAMRDALAGDRARIQIGRISSFGLMEMSRQRLHPSLTETHFETCPHCAGMGIVKTVDTLALAILRAIEESALKKQNANITVTMENNVALYLLNNRRQSLNELESRYNISIIVEIGHVEEECRFTLDNVKKPADQDDDVVDNAPEMANDTNNNAEQDDNNKPSNKKKRQPRRKKHDNQKDAAPVDTNTNEGKTPIAETADNQSSQDDNTNDASNDEAVAKKPAQRRRKKAVKKVDIVDKAAEQADEPKAEKPKPAAKPQKTKEATPKAKPKPKDTEKTIETATNDNADAKKKTAEENIAAAEAETVNKAPKNKKKGWWNKIIEN